jgi:NAD(P)-dependent dehydrogenase (short-subunit alcohol dehydrogenase family)
MPTVLITGANRGLGLEFCRQYGTQGWNVIACCRKPGQAAELAALKTDFPGIRIEALDIEDFDKIDELAKKSAMLDIDVLINNAGVYDDKSSYGFGKLDYQLWQHSLLVNTLAPMKMAEAFFNNIKHSNKKLIVNITSLMGSITDNGSGGSYYYRSSKSALNSAMYSLAIDLKNQGVGVLILHPGWVRTDMGGPGGLIDSTESVSGMMKQIESFTLAQTGAFLKYDGKILPW